MGTRDQKLTPRSRTQHPTCSQNRHWAAEDAEVRGGAAKDTTGDHCSDAILYPFRYRQPMEYITHVGSDGRKLGQLPPNKTGSRTQNSVQPSQGTKRKPSQQYRISKFISDAHGRDHSVSLPVRRTAPRVEIGFKKGEGC